jgi:succinate dehydrogenase / fumarate reductase membrane anchor subunit
MNNHHSVSSDTGRVADHQATRTWLSERLTGLALIPLCLWLAVQLVNLARLNQAEFVESMGQPARALPMIAFLMISAYHAWLGLECILDDYVHHPLIKRASRLTIALTLFGVVAVAAFALYTMIQAAS